MHFRFGEKLQNRISADNILFLVRSKAAQENAKLRQTLEAFPDIRMYYDSFTPNVKTIARKMCVDPGKLPLIVATTKPLNTSTHPAATMWAAAI